MLIEIIGIIASVFILCSLTFKCVSIKRNIIMRTLNAIGSVTFVIYGICLITHGTPSWSIVICNGLMFIFNTYHIIKLANSLKNNNA